MANSLMIGYGDSSWATALDHRSQTGFAIFVAEPAVLLAQLLQMSLKLLALALRDRELFVLLLFELRALSQALLGCLESRRQVLLDALVSWSQELQRKVRQLLELVLLSYHEVRLACHPRLENAQEALSVVEGAGAVHTILEQLDQLVGELLEVHKEVLVRLQCMEVALAHFHCVEEEGVLFVGDLDDEHVVLHLNFYCELLLSVFSVLASYFYDDRLFVGLPEADLLVRHVVRKRGRVD